MFNFLPHTPLEREEMLNAIGVQTLDDLFSDIPPQLRENITYDPLPESGQCEWDLQQTLKAFSSENQATGKLSFLGGGAYPRFIPMAVNTLAGRSEFYTAYTPYQPEMSQGTLQVGYEFQTLMSVLTGMDAANASVYDGGTALAEAALMALRITKKKILWVDRSVHPHYRGILASYAEALGDVSIVEQDFSKKMPEPDTTVAAILVQHPNFFGQLMPMHFMRDWCDASKALLVVSSDPVSLGALQAPGEYGADIVVGDIQPLGNHLSFGGPYGGFMATRTKYTRQLPGRLVGQSVDKDGRPCYTLTMQTREQHIRREKATSNICTNQALNVLRATIYLSLMGPVGLEKIAKFSVMRAHELANKLATIDGVRLPMKERAPTFNEFVVQLNQPVEPVLAALESRGILGGIALEAFYPEFPNTLLVSATELISADDVERYVAELTAILSNEESSSLQTSTSSTTTASLNSSTTNPLEACLS